jgi:CzcA family heavy metal efflux pump
MFNFIIKFSLTHRMLIVSLAILLMAVGQYQTAKLPIDVLPDLDRPRVTVMTECEGMAPEEVETLVTTPLETTLNGATGILAVRSNSTVGLSIITIEFNWNVDPYLARQIVSERLRLSEDRLPEGISPQMAPIASVMGQIIVLSMWDEQGTLSPLELRTIGDWVVAKQLLEDGRIANILVMGGGRKQYQVLVDPDKLREWDVTLENIELALQDSNQNVNGGYITGQSDDQYLVRSIGRVQSIEDLEKLVVKPDSLRPVTLSELATVIEGPQVKVGDSSAYVRNEDGSFSGGKAVVLTIEKQPGVDTRRLTKDTLKTVAEIERTLQQEHPGLRIECIYQQRAFIDLAVHNVAEALWLGAILVAVTLFMFLGNFRTTFITLTAIPLSIVSTCLVFAAFGLSVNTMTLGGLAVAIGELVDDAIVDVENIFRRLKENNQLKNPRPTLRVVYDASSEIRNSVVYGTMMVCLGFLPLFFLSGIEGRLFIPLGIAYVVSIASSLFISLTLTPVLSALLLPSLAKKSKEEEKKESVVLRLAKYLAGAAIGFSLHFPKLVLTGAAGLVVLATVVYFNLDRNFMPAFNEGAVQLNIDLMPGKSLETSNLIAENLASQIQEVEGVTGIVRKSGRAELDEHAVPVNTTEFVLSIDPESGRSLDEIQDELNSLLDAANIPGTVAFSDQPLQHLIMHLRSGTKARIAIKLRGDELSILRERATRIQSLIENVPGIGRIRIDPIQVDIPQVKIQLDREKLAENGLTPGSVNEMIETAMNGRVVTEVIKGQRFFDVLLRFDEPYREDLDMIRNLNVPTPSGNVVPLKTIADIDTSARGPSQIDHEASRRQIVIQSNPIDRGAVDVKNDIEAALAPYRDELTDGGYSYELTGLFESEQDASKRIAIVFIFSLFGVFLVLYTMFRSTNISLQVLSSLPLALVGGVAAIALTGQDRTIPNLVGMISLCGTASRNGILLLDHYFHLVRYEGEGWTKRMIIRAGKDRTAPVLMTAVTSTLGLLPLTMGAHEPGREILYPIATVVVGGMITSTLMEFFVRPALFWTFGRKAAQKALERRELADGNPLTAETVVEIEPFEAPEIAMLVPLEEITRNMETPPAKDQPSSDEP